mgnify:CR=1 FL=1
MGYNAISGTIAASSVKLANVKEIKASSVSGSLLYGDGSNISNLPKIVANASADNILTVGATAEQMVGEPNLTFNGSLLTVSGDVSASANISASIFYGDASGLVNLPAGGPNYSLQFRDISSGGSVSGSSGLIYSGSTLVLSGNFNMSGTMNMQGDLIPTLADTYDLGSAAKPWKDLYISGSSIHFGSEVLSVGLDNNLKFGSGSTTRGFDVGFMNFKNNGIFMDPGRLFKLRAYQIQMFGGIGYIRKTVDDDYTIREIDYLIGVQSNSLTASVTLTLPDADNLLNGQTYVIKDEGGNVNTHNIIIVAQSGDTIDGQNSIILESSYASIQLYCNGVNKYFVC